MSYVTPKLPNRVIPLTRDCDRALSIQRKDQSGDPVDWDASVYMLIDLVRGEPPVQVNGVVDGSLASIRVEQSVANACKSGTTWRVVMSQPGSPSLETPLLVGTFERNDGK